MAVGQVLEARLPLRVTGESPVIYELCLADSSASLTANSLDCIMPVPVVVPSVATRAPLDSYFSPGPLVTIFTGVTADSVFLREGPGAGYAALATFNLGHVFRAIGRNEAGDWIQVQNARYTGWLSISVITPNGDLLSLPVVAPP